MTCHVPYGQFLHGQPTWTVPTIPFRMISSYLLPFSLPHSLLRPQAPKTQKLCLSHRHLTSIIKDNLGGQDYLAPLKYVTWVLAEALFPGDNQALGAGIYYYKTRTKPQQVRVFGFDLTFVCFALFCFALCEIGSHGFHCCLELAK